MKIKKQSLFLMICLILLVFNADAHSGPEPHCQKNNYKIPCYDEQTKDVIFTSKDSVHNARKFVQTQSENKNVKRVNDHYIGIFEEGIIVCGSLHTDNEIALELLFDPEYDGWDYGKPEMWVRKYKLDNILSDLHEYYFCRNYKYKK